MSIFLNLKLILEEDTFYVSVGERISFNRARMCKNEILVYVLTIRFK